MPDWPLRHAGIDRKELWVGVEPSAIAVALAQMPQVWRALLAEHVPDAQRRCSACRWQTRAADPWPCALYAVAEAAQRAANRGLAARSERAKQ